jgi:hypothetical protein
VSLAYAVQQPKPGKSGEPEKSLLGTWWFYVIIAVLVYFVAFWVLKPIGSEELAASVEALQFMALAVFSTLVFAIVARKFKWLNTKTGQIMTSIAIGFMLYTIAESIYFALQLSYGPVSVPVPSAADIFWVSAYIPFAAAFVLAIRAIRMKFTRAMLGLWIVLSAAILVVVVGVIVAPIVVAATGPDAFSTDFSMVYPFEDVVIIVLVLVILLKFRSGEVAKPWAVLILGFILTAVGDIWFGYVTYANTYSIAYDPVDFFLSLGYLASIAAGLLFTRSYGKR